MKSTEVSFQSHGLALLLIIISNNLARYGIMSSAANFEIPLELPFGLKDIFLPIVDNRFL